ncbi:hypothetical protein BZA05DRAFT_412456 [Tricharina praecox]|uniref:uncharacterized protein n=1 Tax=Tricharina praecox TaxID=43433 RepID=UPI00221EE669|nr:uncharacterized protein BZA05DRAFT_412456 [Tricharina praecox]KAI5842251.1 hypothetical protein BZA05DRAFT_412456 [Tricharina praecox]
MSAPRSRRSGLILPLALTATVAAASYALYYFISDSDTHDTSNTTHVHESDAELNRRTGSRRRSGSESAGNSASRKQSIALVVRESSDLSAMLKQLPSPLPLSLADVFVLIYSPHITAHPLSDSDAAAFENRGDEGKVYRQARKMFPKESPRELVMPYTDEASLVPMLKQLAPRGVYIESSLVGPDASVVKDVLGRGWVGGVVVSVEEPAEGQRIADAAGRLLKRVKVLDVARVGDDWTERVG